MKSWKWRLLFPFILVGLLVLAKYILWNFPVSNGKRVGNLTKISKKGKFWFTKTWEGTIDEGSGDQLTSQFSVKDEGLAEELYKYEGKEVVIYYEQHFLGWPRETNYVVTSWKPKNSMNFSSPTVNMSNNETVAGELSKTLFCSLLGSLYKNEKLYQEVKEFIKNDNLYLYKKYSDCNN